MENIKYLFKNPIIIFGLAVILLSLFLAYSCHFNVPDFYTNKELAWQIANTVEPSEVSNAVKHLFNPKHNLYNLIFQIWGWLSASLIFCVCFKVNNFKKFTELTIFNKKPFVYLWINISYIIWSFTFLSAYMIDLDKYVYHSSADSMGIPFFSMMFALVIIGIIYYPLMNLLVFITFNTKIKRAFYSLFWAIVFLFWVYNAYIKFSGKFSINNLILDLHYLIFCIFIIYALGYSKINKKDVPQQNTNTL